MDPFVERFPAWAEDVLVWLRQPVVLWSILGSSIALFFLSVIGVPWFLARVPADYFSRHERKELGIAAAPKPWWVHVLRAIKNVVGLLLLAAGIAMLFMPGQGILTIVVATALLDFPGKRRLQRRVLAVRGVRRAIDALRRRAGREPLHAPGEDTDDDGHYRHPRAR